MLDNKVRKYFFLLFLGLQISLFAQSDDASTVQEIRCQTGKVTFVKSENSLHVFGKVSLSDELKSSVPNWQNLSFYVEFMLHKDCTLDSILLKSTVSNPFAKKELEQFITLITQEFHQKDYSYLFQLDNDLGFTNPDTCSDNLSVVITFE